MTILSYFIIRRISSTTVDLLFSDFTQIMEASMSVNEFLQKVLQFKENCFQFLVNDEILKNPIISRIPKISLVDPSGSKNNYTWLEIRDLCVTLNDFVKQELGFNHGLAKPGDLNEGGLLFLFKDNVYDNRGHFMPRLSMSPRLLTQTNLRIFIKDVTAPFNEMSYGFNRYENISDSLLIFLISYSKNKVKLRYDDRVFLKPDIDNSVINILKEICKIRADLKLEELGKILNLNKIENMDDLKNKMITFKSDDNTSAFSLFASSGPGLVQIKDDYPKSINNNEKTTKEVDKIPVKIPSPVLNKRESVDNNELIGMIVDFYNNFDISPKQIAKTYLDVFNESYNVKVKPDQIEETLVQFAPLITNLTNSDNNNLKSFVRIDK